MQNVKIQFKGITRNTDDGMCQDGESMELINAHVNNGSIEPIGKPILKAYTQRAYKNVYYHANASRYIGVTDSGQMYEIAEDFSEETIMSPDVKAKAVSFIGNTIAVSTDSGMKYFLFKQGSYTYLGGLPELPKITIDKKLRVIQTDVEGSDWDSYGSYLKCVSEANSQGYYAHSAAFRIAYRLYDGSYIKHSHIRLLYLTENDTQSKRGDDDLVFKGSNRLFNGPTSTEFQETTLVTKSAGLLAFSPEFTCEYVDLSSWSDIILSIDIFSTENFRHVYNNPRFYDVKDDIEQPYERAIKMSRFYLIGSINPYDKPDGGKFPAVSIQKNVSSDNLAVQEELTDDQFTHNDYSYSGLTAYNNMLHAWGRKEYLFTWYDDGVFFDNTDQAGTLCDLYVVIEGYNKEITLKKSVRIPNTFGPYLMYPDTRAKAIFINNPTLRKSKRFTLKTHPTLNLSYYCLSSEDDDRSEASSFKLEDMSKWTGISSTMFTTDNVDRQDDNILRVSGSGNPFFFPAERTYQFNTPIVGMQSNVIAMSQGQFGQFPLYVFTKEGVFALSVGQGTTAYSTQTPVTRDVCNNPDSICALDTSVAFSTDKGLMVISGAQTELISENIYGFLPSCTISSPIIGKILEVAKLGSSLSSVTFPDYLEGAKVGFNYQGQEIIVANKDYDYSYVFSLKTAQWHKISQNIQSFVNAYPQTWALNGQNIYDLNNFHRTVSTMALISRPIKMGTLTHKRIVQTALRGIVKRSLSDLYFRGEPVMFRNEEVDIFSNVGMYILGSNDAEHFSLVAKKEMMVDIRDLVTKMNKSKPYKYFMVCLVGGVRTDVSFNYIEMNVDESFTNRLR